MSSPEIFTTGISLTMNYTLVIDILPILDFLPYRVHAKVK